MAVGIPGPFFGQVGNAFNPGNNIFQQALMQQYQQNAANQISTTVFTNVPSEDVARRWEVAPNNTVYFINVNEGYIYIKSAGASILEPAKFTKIRLEEEVEGQATQVQTQEPEKPQVNMDEYMTKTEFESKFEPYKNIIDEMQEVVKELKG